MAKSITKFLAVVLIIAALCYIALYGIVIGSTQYMQPVKNGIKKGLDIAGGSSITYEAVTGAVITKQQADTVKAVLRKRLDGVGFTEASVSSAQGDKRYIVEIPQVTNPEEAVRLLGNTAELKFVDPDKNLVLSGKDVKEAKSEYQKLSENSAPQHYVSLTLNTEGVAKFAEATKRLSTQAEGKNYIAIMLDEKEISRPRVKSEINSEKCIIEGGFNAESAKELASTIRAGQLPFKLKEVALSSVGATLGDKALQSSLQAALIALILVMIYMMAFYRLPGLIASVALVGYTALLSLLLGIFQINLTLPGMAGIVLTIGVAVDANVVIFERIKDELTLGKTLRAAVDAGFNRAFSAILDSNVTTLIAGFVLMWFGTGPIKGFAITLIMGIITSLFTAVVVSRFLLEQMIGLNIKNVWLYGGKRVSK